jgi:hypothetical protein
MIHNRTTIYTRWPQKKPDVEDPQEKKTQGNISGYTHVVEFVIESAGVADGLSVLVASPEGRGGCLAVGAARPGPPGRALQTLQEGEVASVDILQDEISRPECTSLLLVSPT